MTSGFDENPSPVAWTGEGVFFTASGWGLDMTGKTPTWRNYRLKR